MLMALLIASVADFCQSKSIEQIDTTELTFDKTTDLVNVLFNSRLTIFISRTSRTKTKVLK